MCRETFLCSTRRRLNGFLWFVSDLWSQSRSQLGIRFLFLCLQLFVQLYKGVESRIYRFVCRIDQLAGLVFPDMAFHWFDRGTRHTSCSLHHQDICILLYTF